MKTAACLVAALLSVAAGPARARALSRSEGGLDDPASQQPPGARTAALTRQLGAAMRALALRPEGGAADEDELMHELGASIGALERNEGAPREGELPPEEPLGRAVESGERAPPVPAPRTPRGQGVRGVAEAVAASLLRSEGSSSPTVMDEMMTLVGRMQDGIVLDHNRSQDLVSQIAGNFSVCTADGEWAGYKSTYELKLPLHAACRAAELQLNSTYTSCEAEKTAHCEIKKVKCEDLESEEIKPNEPELECGLVLPREQYIARIAANFERLNRTYQEKKLTCEVVSEPCDTKVCDLLELQTKRQECDALLSAVQAAACGWATAKKLLCNRFDGCWKGATDGYAELKAMHKNEAKQRRLSWRIMERLKCFIKADAAADKSAEIDKCLNAPQPDTSHLNLIFPPLPPNPGCQDPVIYPCSDPYLAAIRVSGVDLPACQACSLP